MKVLLAFDSFKGTMTSLEVAGIVKKGLKNKYPTLDIKTLEIGDGGEGTLDAIINQIGGEKRFKRIVGPHFEEIEAPIGIKGNTCFIESASVVGFKYKRKEDTPSSISTYGIGELIKYALDLDMKNIYICLGGTTSNDGGCGLARALSAKFYNKEGLEFTPMGVSLNEIEDIELENLDKRLKNVNIYGLVDVINPLFGKNGASYVYGPQKGASEAEVIKMDEGLRRLSQILLEKYQLDLANFQGSGAAGGLGYGLISFLNGKIKKGIETILDLLNFNDIIEEADIIFTGEGRLDAQSFQGKVIDGIFKKAKDKDVIGIFGIVDENVEIPYKFKKIYEINSKHLPFEEVKKHTKSDLEELVKTIDLS